MEDIALAKAEIQKGLKLFKAFENGEAILSVLEGAAATQNSLEKKIAGLRAEGAKLAEENARAIADKVKIEAHVKSVEEAARARADQIIAAGKVEFDRILLVANQKSEEMEKKLAVACEHLDAMDKELAGKKEELARLNTAIAELRAKIGA